MAGWVIVQVRCRMCGHECVAVQPTDMIRDGQCPECEHFTCEILEYL